MTQGAAAPPTCREEGSWGRSSSFEKQLIFFDSEKLLLRSQLYPPNLIRNQFRVTYYLVSVHNLSFFHLVSPIFKPLDLAKRMASIISERRKISH
jgi:hypothetical protein